MTTSATHGEAVIQDVPADSPLQRLSDLAQELGSERIHEEAQTLAQRTAEGRFYVACLGQFKRGKSTLLNALLGDPVLPTGVLPLTTVPTVVRFGKSRSARVRFEGGTWTDIPPEDLPQYVSEELNPENTNGVMGVEVFSPSPLLEQGMCFVDTPGLGSVFAGNTAATQAFIPHIDAALVVVGADPPITGEELALVGSVGREVANFVVVLNKADRTTEGERQVAKSFATRMLEKQLHRPIEHIYEVSAEERLSNRGGLRDWPKLTAALERLVRESGADLVRAAGERGRKRIASELFAIVSEERAALVRPVEESERRIRSLRQTISEAERSLRDVAYLFTSEEHRLSDQFLEQRKQFLAETMPTVHAEFEQELRGVPRHYGPRFRRRALRLAQIVAERHVRPWLEVEQAGAEQEYRKVASRFVGIGNDFLKRLAQSGVPEFTRLPEALDSDGGFRVPSRFTFEQLLHVALPASPLRYFADVFLGIVQAYAAIEKRAWAFLDYLMEMNSTRVQSDVVNRIQESRGQLEVEIRKLLHEVTRIAERALDRARTARAEGSSGVEAALARLNRAEAVLRSVSESVQTDRPIASGEAVSQSREEQGLDSSMARLETRRESS
jgi:GTPase SAR1 family protein